MSASLVGVVAGVIFAAVVLAAVVNALRPRHEAVKTEKVIDQAGEGETCLRAVCSCNASRDMSGGRWSSYLCRVNR